MSVRKAALRIPALLVLMFGCTGCTELYALFGPGGIFGPDSGVLGTTGTQPTIPAPTFSASQLDPDFEATSGAKVVIAADMNGDGLTDLVSGSNENQPIQLHLRTGATVDFNTFSIAGGGPISRMIDLAARDIDGDGNLDVAVLINDTGFTPVMGASIRGSVSLLFAPDDVEDVLDWEQVTIDAIFTLPGDGKGITDFALVDMNGDDLPDIVLATNEADNTDLIRLYFNPGGAAARNGANWTESTAPIAGDVNEVVSIEVADVDGDGDLDVIGSFPTAATFNIRWLQNPLDESGAAAVAAGNWTLHFLGQQGEADPDNQGGDVIAAGDIDGDGDIDVAAAHAALGLVQWFENPGPALVAAQSFPWRVFNLGQLQSGVTINQLQLVDLNLDGQLDAFVTASGNLVGFQPGDELFDFWLGFSILATDPVADIGRCAFTDLNADARLDIIAPLDRVGLATDQFVIFTRTSQ